MIDSQVAEKRILQKVVILHSFKQILTHSQPRDSGQCRPLGPTAFGNVHLSVLRTLRPVFGYELQIFMNLYFKTKILFNEPRVGIPAAYVSVHWVCYARSTLFLKPNLKFV